MSNEIKLNESLEFAEYLCEFWSKYNDWLYVHKQNNLYKSIKDVYYFWADQKSKIQHKEMVKNKNLPYNKNKAIEEKENLDKLVKERADIKSIEKAERYYNQTLQRIKEIEAYIDNPLE